MRHYASFEAFSTCVGIFLISLPLWWHGIPITSHDISKSIVIRLQACWQLCSCLVCHDRAFNLILYTKSISFSLNFGIPCRAILIRQGETMLYPTLILWQNMWENTSKNTQVEQECSCLQGILAAGDWPLIPWKFQLWVDTNIENFETGQAHVW